MIFLNVAIIIQLHILERSTIFVRRYLRKTRVYFGDDTITRI